MERDRRRALPEMKQVPRTGPRPTDPAGKEIPGSEYILVRRRNYLFRDGGHDEADTAVSDLFEGLEHLGRYGW